MLLLNERGYARIHTLVSWGINTTLICFCYSDGVILVFHKDTGSPWHYVKTRVLKTSFTVGISKRFVHYFIIVSSFFS